MIDISLVSILFINIEIYPNVILRYTTLTKIYFNNTQSKYAHLEPCRHITFMGIKKVQVNKLIKKWHEY